MNRYNSDYPFRPPKFFIDGKKYRDILCLNDPILKGYLRKLNIQCLCCNTKLCHHLWVPCINLVNIVEEYVENRELISRLLKIYYVKKICEQNNIHCLELHDLISQHMLYK